MSNNLKVVEYFVRQFVEGNTEQMANFVTPDFLYHLNLGEGLDFKEFIERMWILQSSSNLDFGEIKSDDDIHFYYDFKLTLPPPNQDKEAFGLAQLVVKNSLISRVFVDYREDKTEFDEFQNLMINSSTVLI